MIRLFFFFSTTIFLFCSAAEDVVDGLPLSSSDGGPSSIVAGCVNVITGDYIDSVQDLALAGPAPLTLERTWCSKWFRSFFNTVTYDCKDGNLKSYLRDPSGRVSTYHGRFIGNSNKHYSTLKMDLEEDGKGVTNYASGVISGRTNLKNNRVYLRFTKDGAMDAKAELGDGTWLFYEHNPINDSVFLTREERTNGSRIRYFYNGGDTTKIEALGGGKTFSHLRFHYPSEKEVKKDLWAMQILSSDGREAKYWYKKDKHGYLLTKVECTSRPMVRYKYERQIRGERDNLILKVLPENRYKRIHYYKKESKDHLQGRFGTESSKDFFVDRVRAIEEPAGDGGKPVATYSFLYSAQEKKKKKGTETFAGFTEVIDANQAKTRYRYDADHRITSVEKCTGGKGAPYKKAFSEKFTWGKKGSSNETHLMSRRIEAPDGTCFALRTFSYDSKGNALQEKIYGNFSGKGKSFAGAEWQDVDAMGVECEVKEYTYTCDEKHRSRNLMLSQKESNGKTIVYRYKDFTDLLEAKLVSDGKKIVQRHFYEYDETATLVKEIKDDGCEDGKENLAGVTERHITYILPTAEMPYGLPWVKEEKALDMLSGSEKLLRKTVYAYSKTGKKISEEHYDSNGAYCYTLKWSYDDHGNTIKEIDALGHVIERRYDANDNLVFEHGPSDVCSKNFIYDFCNRLVKEEIVSSKGEVLTTSYRYDPLGQKIASIDACGNETRFVYDALGRIVETHHPKFADFQGKEVFPVSKTEYDILGYPEKFEDAEGHATYARYNMRGKPVEIRYPDGALEAFTYNIDGTLQEAFAKNGTITKYVHDIFGRLLEKAVYSQEGELLEKESHVYNSFHKISSTDASGATTYYTYDFAGRPSAVVRGRSKTDYEYDTLGRICKMREWYGDGPEEFKATVKLYDFLNRVVEERVEDGDGHVLSILLFEYDACGNVIKKSHVEKEGLSSTSTEYNFLNQPVKIVDPMGEQTHFIYNYRAKNGCGETVLEVMEVDPLGNKTIRQMNSFEKEALVVKKNAFDEPLSKKEIFYTATGLKAAEVHTVMFGGEAEKSIVHTWHYNQMQKLVQQVQAFGTQEQKSICYEYNAFGQKQAFVKADGSRILYFYDPLGRMKRFEAEDKSVCYSYSYDARHRPVEIVDEVLGNATARSYDDSGHLASEVLANGLKTLYERDRLGRATKVTLPDGSEVHYFYNAVSLKKMVRKGKEGGVVYEHQDLEHDFCGRVLKARLASGSEVQYFYDLCGRLKETHSLQRKESLCYDAAGNLLEAVVDGEKTVYGYDGLYQLTFEDGDFRHTYAFDSLYNCKQKDGAKQSFNGLNQLVEDAKGRYFYDANGNLIKKVAAGKESLFFYDALDRLVCFEEDGKKLEYSYDAFNRRLSKRSFKQGGFEEEFYLYQEQNEVGVADASGTIVSLRVLGAGKGAEIGSSIAFEFGSNVLVPLHDYQGSVALLMDRAGNVEESYCYGAFGEEKIFNSFGEELLESSFGNAWRFSSKRKDEETGFVYFGRRYYDPATSRWTTEDPIGFDAGPNVYAYVLNSPLTHFDLYGLFAVAAPFYYHRLSGAFGSMVHTALSYCAGGFKALGAGLDFIGFDAMPIPFIGGAAASLGQGMQSNKWAWKSAYAQEGSKLHGPVGSEENFSDTLVFFTNGVKNTSSDAQKSAEIVSKSLGDQKVSIPGNGTRGVFYDLTECAAQKLGIPTYSVELMVKTLKEACMQAKHVIVYLHSQAGIIFNDAMKHFAPEELNKMMVYTFGTAKIIDDKRLGDVHNYVSRHDAVTCLSDPIGYSKAMLFGGDHVTFLNSNQPWFIDHNFDSETYDRGRKMAVDRINDRLKR